MQKASSVGLGWGLNAGGFITRVVKVYNFEINGHTSRAFCKGYLL
jgi:hypothetical protein